MPLLARANPLSSNLLARALSLLEWGVVALDLVVAVEQVRVSFVLTGKSKHEPFLPRTDPIITDLLTSALALHEIALGRRGGEGEGGEESDGDRNELHFGGCRL